ncbi:carboxypeptidase regulatory-like domain-containing protein [Gimesia maris]|uniref:carboxypeptidase regulatory-like domain-containing protein n=1 Tax=Gimesia maris TaxID=122 RepID=UPI00241CF3F4|nr:carboxypeptidase regulatory-like domain-containing protein [Gimesia maris]|tara:strand:- start:205 stop:645 length:441 start_codon:yes stop_codon:yes gene_type:complete
MPSIPFQFPFVSRYHCLLMLSLILAGCSGKSDNLPELAEVTGQVTLDGNPLPDAIIDFYPQGTQQKKQSRASTAATDGEGKYSLMYNNNTAGAILGDHLVRISKTEGGAEVAGPEMLPKKYNETSTLKATVTKDGPNTINFELTSK